MLHSVYEQSRFGSRVGTEGDPEINIRSVVLLSCPVCRVYEKKQRDDYQKNYDKENKPFRFQIETSKEQKRVGERIFLFWFKSKAISSGGLEEIFQPSIGFNFNERHHSPFRLFQPINFFTTGILFKRKIIPREMKSVTMVISGISTMGFIVLTLIWNPK